VKPRAILAALTLILVTLAGCGRSPDALCADFADECGDQNSADDCRERADELRAEATEKQCLDLWEAYVGCVDDLDSLCNAASACAQARDDLATYCEIHFE
jgi:hypothetical protein